MAEHAQRGNPPWHGPREKFSRPASRAMCTARRQRNNRPSSDIILNTYKVTRMLAS